MEPGPYRLLGALSETLGFRIVTHGPDPADARQGEDPTVALQTLISRAEAVGLARAGFGVRAGDRD